MRQKQPGHLKKDARLFYCKLKLIDQYDAGEAITKPMLKVGMKPFEFDD